MTIQLKATEQYFPMVLFNMLYKVVLTFGSEDKILECDYSNESYSLTFICGLIQFALCYTIPYTQKQLKTLSSLCCRKLVLLSVKNATDARVARRSRTEPRARSRWQLEIFRQGGVDMGI